MYINSVFYRDNLFNMTVEKVNFSELNLFVGASGSGKTMIINSIINLKDLANGNSGYPGIEWNINFTTSAGEDVEWSGAIEKTTLPSRIAQEASGIHENKFLREEVIINGKKTISRIHGHGDTPEGKKNFDLCKSVIATEETGIKEEFNKIIFSDNSPQYDFKADKFAVSDQLAGDTNAYSLEDIKKMNLNTTGKLYLTFKHVPEVFENIREKFTGIFPFVEDIRIFPYSLPELPVENKKLQTHPVIQIKEKYSDEWVHETYISSGMLRTLLKIAEIELADDSSVIIIDELENSLGVNSLEILVDEIKYSETEIQFIITSHHPYIIQNIETDTWKLVKRDRNRVITLSAEHIGIGKSKHDRFFELLNTEDYRKGISAE